MPRNIITLSLIAVIVVTALWLVDSPPAQFQPQPDPTPGELVLVQFFDEIDTAQFNQQGLLEHQFSSARVGQHKPATDIEAPTGKAIIDQPHFIFYEQGTPKWELSALSGESDLEDEKLLLRENVQLKQLGKDNSAEISTASLWVDPRTRYANTDDPVTILAPGLITRGRGMIADVNNETIQILAETSTHYETTP